MVCNLSHKTSTKWIFFFLKVFFFFRCIYFLTFAGAWHVLQDYCHQDLAMRHLFVLNCFTFTSLCCLSLYFTVLMTYAWWSLVYLLACMHDTFSVSFYHFDVTCLLVNDLNEQLPTCLCFCSKCCQLEAFSLDLVSGKSTEVSF